MIALAGISSQHTLPSVQADTNHHGALSCVGTHTAAGSNWSDYAQVTETVVLIITVMVAVVCS